MLVARVAAQQNIQLFDRLEPGDLLLLGSRRGQGKTICAVKLLISAITQGRRGWYFSLENDKPDMERLFASAGEASRAIAETLVVDHSDEVCAQYIIEQVRGNVPEKSVVVIDYLQILDQRRTSPELQAQVMALQSFAHQSATIFVFISQIHGSFDSKPQCLPALADVRLPNPLDLRLFNKSLFLHEGQSRLHVPRAKRSAPSSARGLPPRS